MTRDVMDFDVVVVGGGVAGLSAAIRLKQRASAEGRDISVCVLEKGANVGAHVLSGAVIDPIALNELFPDWPMRGAPLTTPATSESFRLLTRTRVLPLPIAKSLSNHGCYVASLGALAQWLGQQAEDLGVDLFPGFAATEVLYKDDTVIGVATGDMGRLKDGREGPSFEPGVELHSTTTLFAEGCRGSLSEHVIKRFDLRRDCAEQTYGLGIKEVWEIDPAKHRPGHVAHTMGWPLGMETYGGGFVYHQADNRVAIGLITGLDYANPTLDPFAEMQRFKTHPAIKSLLGGGRRIAYGARSLNEGGWQSVPTLTFPGGALVGAAAGFMNVARLKGSHTAMKSAMLAADAIFDGDLSTYPARLRESWIAKELYKARNVRPGFGKGLLRGLINAAWETLVGGRSPWTLPHRAKDRDTFTRTKPRHPIVYDAPDGVLTFDRASSVFLSNTHHDEDQPCHLQLNDTALPVARNLVVFAGPEARYCPAGVYEFVGEGSDTRLQINAANCLHCKACDIKDPSNNITWSPPQGGGGPNYTAM